MSGSISRNIKFGVGGEQEHSFRYPHVYERQTRGDRRRLLIGPRDRHVELVGALTGYLEEPLKILYVLVVPRIEGHEAGRYESPELSRADVRRLLEDYGPFLESDGRHHLWIADQDEGLLVYDRHEVVYAYGNTEAFIALLSAWDLKEEPVVVPSPHWHVYHPEFDEDERSMVARFQWTIKPLRDEDA